MRSLFSYWHFEPMVILFLAALCIIYLYAVHFKLTKQYCCRYSEREQVQKISSVPFNKENEYLFFMLVYRGRCYVVVAHSCYF